VYEVSDGWIGAWMGLPTLLLSVTGRKSGLTRTTALVYFEDGGNYVVVGSDGAARRNPQWWKNLKVNPQATAVCQHTCRVHLRNFL
jgi:deazaflavin-dependent oxidoreductase (nitroreductase family)